MVNMPQNVDDSVSVILLYPGESGATFSTTNFKKVPDFDLQVGESKTINDYTFELLAMDGQKAAFLRTTLPNGHIRGS